MSKRTISMEEIMKIATRRAQRNARGGLLPLTQRLSQSQLDTRDVKIWARRTLAEKIVAKQNMLGMVLQNFFSRSFFGRLRWVFTGK